MVNELSASVHTKLIRPCLFRDLNPRPHERGANTLPLCYTAVRPSNHLRYVQHERTVVHNKLNIADWQLTGQWNPGPLEKKTYSTYFILPTKNFKVTDETSCQTNKRISSDPLNSLNFSHLLQP